MLKFNRSENPAMNVLKDLIILNVFVISLIVLIQTTNDVVALITLIISVSIFILKHIKLNMVLKSKLSNKLKFFEALLNSSTDVILYQDTNLNIIACNQILCNVHNKTREEILGKDLKYLFKDNPKNSEICALMIEKLKEVLKTQETVKLFGTVYENEPHYYNILISPTFSGSNKMNGTLLVARNVTAEYNASKRAVEKERQMKCILENVPIDAFMKDKNDKFIIGSSSFEKILDLQKDEKMRQLVLSDIFQQEYLDFVKKEEAEIYKNKKPIITERLIAFPNKTFWGRVCKAPILDDDGNVEYLVVMYENIEAEKEIERQKEYFMETLIHDLKVPTIAQLRGLELLQKGTFGMVNNDQKEILSNITDSCQYILTMISMVLNTYRFENGKNSLYYEKFDLVDIVIQSFEEVAKTAKEKDISFVYQAGEGDTNLEADKEEMKKVVTNLLSNAVVYSNRGEKIIVQIENENNSLKLSITSKGISLSSRECRNLFERSSENNPKFGTVGHGIGLYLCKKIIDMHNGKIFASTDGNMLNTFSFIVPQFRPKIVQKSATPLYI